MPATPPHSSPTVDKPWDGPANKAKIRDGAPSSELRRIYAWVDPEGNPDVKDAYRFIHHEIDGGRIGPANVRGCMAGIGVLNGARGGTTIPSGDRRGVYNHLARHLRDANVEPQPLRGESEMPETLSYTHVLAAVCDELWAILPSKLHAICEFLAVRATGGEISESDKEAIVALNGGPRDTMVFNGTAVIPVHGTIAGRANMLVEASGGTSADLLGRQINEASRDSAIKSILLDINSPGGVARGMTELAATIREARQSKRIVALAHPLAASAAYWIGASASEFVATPSAVVGSIGVIAAHEDMSAALQQKGVKVTLITSSPHKGEGHPFGPLSEEDKAAIQDQVDELDAMFVKDVAAGRRVSQTKVRESFGQGRTVTAQNALAAGMIDSIGTLDQTLMRLAPRRSAQAIQNIRDFEGFLRDVGYSSVAAKRIASGGFRCASDLRDVAEADDEVAAAPLDQRDAADDRVDDGDATELIAAIAGEIKTQVILQHLKRG